MTEADLDPQLVPVPLSDDALWYRDAVIYQLHVKAYVDSNGDGIGDIKGLTSKLDYIRELGVNTIWVLPFYPSPLKDDGYDVADYHGVHPQYGNLNDFRIMLREAHRRGLRVITELVINHTSDQHAWFQAARRAPAGSGKRDFYVWSDSDARYAGTRIIFTDTETSNWSWDPVAKAYYWHRFFSHQPDLNFDNPHVLKAVYRTMRYWLDMGVDGFRLDAVPYLVEREGTNNENLPETHAVIRQLRAMLDAKHPGALLLAEANQWPEDVRDYFGNGDECHMAYHFPLMPRIYMSIAQEDRHPVVDILYQTPEIPQNCQWAIFLRNHDELTLEMVTSKERDYMYRMYAADPRARLNLGIRRRLAPLMENDVDRIKLMNSLLLSMPGSPIIYYGDEIGMGDNIFLGDRNGVRTPMQWSPDRNAGFSRADPQRLYLPPIMDSIYGYEAVNVESQSRDASSLLNWMRRMLAVRKTSHAFGRGKLTLFRPGNRKVLAYMREYEDDVILCVANLGRSAQPVELDLAKYKGRVPVELLGSTPFPPIGTLPYLLTLPAHGFYWFKLATDAPAPNWHEERLAPEEVRVLILFDGWNSFFRDRVVPWRVSMAETVRRHLEEDVLPAYLAGQRWYAAKGEPIQRARLADHAFFQNWLLGILATEGPSEPAHYFLPIALAWDDREEERAKALAPAAIAKVRQQAEVGLLADAAADEAFCRATVAAMGSETQLSSTAGKLRFSRTRAYADMLGTDLATLQFARPPAQSSNTVVILGDKVLLKYYRHLREGPNPELEVGLFLTEVAHFQNCPHLGGALEYTGPDGTTRTLGVLHSYVSNQGDGWDYTLNYVSRHLEERRIATEPLVPDVHGGYQALMATLGQRTAELHKAFSMTTGDAAFDPEPASAADLAQWKAQVVSELSETLRMLEQHRDRLAEPVATAAASLLQSGEGLSAAIASITVDPKGLCKTRYHGDYHLGQVLISKNDFVITDFEGEPGRSFAERRRKHSALRDVAGMLRSFNYASWAAIRQVARVPEDVPVLAPIAEVWEREARASFLDNYWSKLGEKGTAAGLIRLFEIEKALYELRYELHHRPDWVHIPLQGLLELGKPA